MGCKRSAKVFYVFLVMSHLVVFFSAQTVFSACNDILLRSKGSTNSSGYTSHFIAYLTELYSQGEITSADLQLVLDFKGSLLNPISSERASVSAVASIHYKAIEEILRDGAVDKSIFLAWVQATLATNRRIRKERESVTGETAIPYQQIILNRVRPDEFFVQAVHGSHSFGNHKVVLPHALEVMSTPVTQKMWFDVMRENPSVFSKGKDEHVEVVNGKTISIQSDYPVENITWWSVLVFANKLSELHGLKPAYDLRGIEFFKIAWEGEPALTSREIVPAAARGNLYATIQQEPKINAIDGNIYMAEGYRLPTAMEQRYLLEMGAFPPGSREDQQMWTRNNSGGSTHPVAEKLPLRLDGQSFYDVFGNVWEWSWDWHESGDWKPEKEVIDPVNLRGPYEQRKISGGSWDKRMNFSGVPPTNKREDVGFRLVRTIK